MQVITVLLINIGYEGQASVKAQKTQLIRYRPFAGFAKHKPKQLTDTIINLETVNPIEFFGVNNGKLDILKKKFPLLKILSRGTQLKLSGAHLNRLKLPGKKFLLLFRTWNGMVT